MSYDFIKTIDKLDMNHKLFCTFTEYDSLDETVSFLTRSYTILFDKIFVLHAKEQNEYLITYNVDSTNLRDFPKSTILVHRKKESNTLYTINALNELIKELNNGYLDKRFSINWNDYRNTLLLTKGGFLNILKTNLHKVIEF